MGGIRHPRHLTEQQFSDGTTIDGTRIDDALTDLVEHFNSVPLGDIDKIFTQSQFVAGWMPQDRVVTPTHHWPWMPRDNGAGEVVGRQPSKFANPLRTKGQSVPLPRTPSALNNVFTWTTQLPFSDPVIIRDFTLFLTTDHPLAGFGFFDNDFLYGPTASSFPPGLNTASPLSVEDFSISISVDSELNRLDRRLNDLEITRTKFQVLGDRVSFSPLPGSPAGPPAYTDMSLATPWPGGTISGLVIRLRGLNVPIHQRARVRLDITIPQYVIGENGWGVTPWYKQYITSTLTVLEPLV